MFDTKFKLGEQVIYRGELLYVRGTDLASAGVTYSLSNSNAPGFNMAQRRRATGLIKAILIRAEQLATDIRQLEQQTKKKQEQLGKALATIEKLKGGDWSVLKDDKQPESEDKTE